MTGDPAVLGPDGLTLGDMERVTAGARLELDPAVVQRIERSHRRLRRYLSEDRLIYGVTTGYGALADREVGADYSAELQVNLIAHLSAGVGEPLSRHHTRALIAARIATLARGHSGVSLAAVEGLLRLLNQDALPAVPSMGTVGASGDLTPLAHVAGALMGKGNMRHAGGPEEPAETVLRRIGMRPLEHRGKDAIALVNGTAAMTGIAACNSSLAHRAVRWSALLSAVHDNVLGGRGAEAWHPSFGEVRRHPGQRLAHAWLNALLQGADATHAGTDTQQVARGRIQQRTECIQDPYTLRCAPQLLGAVIDQLSWHDQLVETELNSVTDNPILPDGLDVVLHGGNFFGQHVAFAADGLANAVTMLAVHAERRIARLANPRLNRGLPAFLQGYQTGLNSGFMGAQVTASALLAEMRTLSTPASIQSIPTNGDNQDVVTMGTIAARRCGQLLNLCFRILAIDALMLAQAVDLRKAEERPSCFVRPSSKVLHEWVRRYAEFLRKDRSLGPEIEVMANAMRDSAGPVDTLAAFSRSPCHAGAADDYQKPPTDQQEKSNTAGGT